MDEIYTYYENLAGKYDADRFENSYGKFIHTQEVHLLSKIILPANNQEVVDLACGSGRLLEYANCGLDFSPNMIEVAKKKFPNKNILLANADNLPFNDNSVDIIYSFHFFMHLNKDAMEKVIQECFRVLKPNGRLVFDIPSKKRRTLLNYKAKGWHAANSTTVNELKELTKKMFKVKEVFGLLFIPVHRLPKVIRKSFVKLDALLSNSFLREYSSYLVIDMKKNEAN